jgi:hypothetical protein
MALVLGPTSYIFYNLLEGKEGGREEREKEEKKGGRGGRMKHKHTICHCISYAPYSEVYQQ